MIIAFTVFWLLLVWATRHHPRRRLLWCLETVWIWGCAAYALNLSFGGRVQPLPWRIYIDQSASMAWGERDAKAKQWASQLKAETVYFADRVARSTSGPVGDTTYPRAVYDDWQQVSSRFSGVVLVSDGAFAELPAQYITPWNCVQVTGREEVKIPTIEAPDTAEIGKPIQIKTQAEATLWVNGELLGTQDGVAQWSPRFAGKALCYAQIGKGITSKEITVVSPEPPYVLRIVAGVDPAVPMVREALVASGSGLGISLLQWNGKHWRWKGKAYDTPLWDVWWGQAEWVWLDSDTWQALDEKAKQAIWNQWERTSLGVYFAGQEQVAADWQKVLPGIKGDNVLWGFTDSVWGPKAWTKSAALAELTAGAHSPGPGFAYHITGKHRVVQHTGTDWSIGLRRDIKGFWGRLSAWLAEGKRPQAQLTADTIQLHRPANLTIRIRDQGLSQIRVLVTQMEKPENTRLLTVLPDNLRLWQAAWTPASAGLYRVTVSGTGEAGNWVVEEVYNVPPAAEEMRNGRFPTDETLLHLAAASKGSYQKDSFDPRQLVPARLPPRKIQIRDFPSGLGLIGLCWLYAWYVRLKYKR